MGSESLFVSGSGATMDIESPTADVAPTAPMCISVAPMSISFSDPCVGESLASTKKSQACADSSFDGSAGRSLPAAKKQRKSEP